MKSKYIINQKFRNCFYILFAIGLVIYFVYPALLLLRERPHKPDYYGSMYFLRTAFSSNSASESLPYSEKGSESAIFDMFHRLDWQIKWFKSDIPLFELDIENKRVINSSIEYLNPKDFPREQEIVIVVGEYENTIHLLSAHLDKKYPQYKFELYVIKNDTHGKSYYLGKNVVDLENDKSIKMSKPWRRTITK